MSLVLRQSKGSPLTFEEMDGNLTFLQSIAGGSTIPSTAKLYFPDVETLFGDILYILGNDPVAPSDPIWANFLTPAVVNVADLDPSIPVLVYNKGIYEEVTNADEESGTTSLNIGYSGVTNIGAFSETQEYAGGNYFLMLETNNSTEDVVAVDLSVKTDIEVAYKWNYDSNNDLYETLIYFQNIPNYNNAISVNIVVDNSGETPTGTYDIQVFGSSN